MKWLKRLTAQASITQDLFRFLWRAKRWWLIPMVVVVLLMSLLLAMQQTALAPFVYTLF